MFKKIAIYFCCGFFLISLCGCVALLAGAAGGAGAAVWLSGKLSKEFNYSYDHTLDSTKRALNSLDLEILKDTESKNRTTQLKSTYQDGKEIWIDIHKKSPSSTKVEVRVGGVDADKEAASKILQSIENHL